MELMQNANLKEFLSKQQFNMENEGIMEVEGASRTTSEVSPSRNTFQALEAHKLIKALIKSNERQSSSSSSSDSESETHIKFHPVRASTTSERDDITRVTRSSMNTYQPKIDEEDTTTDTDEEDTTTGVDKEHTPKDKTKGTIHYKVYFLCQ